MRCYVPFPCTDVRSSAKIAKRYDFPYLRVNVSFYRGRGLYVTAQFLHINRRVQSEMRGSRIAGLTMF